MSDGTLDSNAGGAFEDTANGWAGGLSDKEALDWYGLLSLVMGLGTPFLFMFFNDKTYVAMNTSWFMRLIEFYLPVGMAWVLLSYFPGEFMNMVTKNVLALCILGPWLFQWEALYQYFLAGDGIYTELFYWVWGAVYGLLTIFQGVLQIAFLPKAFDHLDYDFDGQEDNSIWYA